MIQKDDGFTYFNYKGRPTDSLPSNIDYKFKDLADGNYEAYQRNNKDELPIWNRLQTFIKPDGTDNVILLTFKRLLEEQRVNEANESFKPYSGAKAKNSGKDIFNFRLNNHFKEVLIDNNITIGPYLNRLIENDLMERGLL